MKIVSAPPLASSLLFIALGLFVLLKSKRKDSNIPFFLICLTTFVWQFSWAILFSYSELLPAYFFIKFGYTAIIFLPIVYFHFICAFTRYERGLLLVRLAYLTGLLFAFLLWFSNLLIDGYLEHPWGKYPKAGAWHPLYIGFLLFLSLEAIRILLQVKNKARGRNLLECKYILFSLLLYLPAGSDFIINYGFSFYPFGFIFILLSLITIAYAIVRYKLLEIDVVIRKTLIFAGLVAFVFGVFSVGTFLVQEGLVRLGAGKIWTYAISLFLIVLGYDPIRNFLVNVTDRYFFQKKYDYQKILKDATRGMAKIESLHHLLGLVVHFVTMKMRVRTAAVMIKRRDSEFELGYQRGYEKSFLEYHLDDANPMIHYLKREKEAIDTERIKEFMEEGKKKVKGEAPHVYDFQAIHLTMQELNAVCVVPSFLGRELNNILLLGEKKSGEYYTNEDLNVLFTLAQESAIAIENAKLFDEAINKSQQLTKINEQLEYSRNLLMKALRETEVANKQLQDTQAQLIHEQKMATLGRLAASVGHEVNNPLTILSMNVSRAILKYRKNPDLRVGEVLDLFQKMEQNIGRIKAVVNTLTGLLKRSEKGKFEPLSLKLILEETLPLVQFQTYLDNLTGTEVEFDIPASTPLVRGDLERLQEVFLNLFINAYHAMAGKRNRKIGVTAEMDPENTQNVGIHFTDNGCGMTEDIMKKIFNYGFTTKPPGRGSGMGLYMCKYIIELHGGDIRVKSKVGEGTTFTITLPAYEEASGEASNMRLNA